MELKNKKKMASWGERRFQNWRHNVCASKLRSEVTWWAPKLETQCLRLLAWSRAEPSRFWIGLAPE